MEKPARLAIHHDLVVHGVADVAARACGRRRTLGDVVERRPVPPAVAARVHAAQPMGTRAAWWMADTWDGLLLYRVSKRD